MRQIAIFIVVGTAAALTHLATVAFTVETIRLPPLAANIIGFCVAFLVSFNGHSRFTFPVAPDRYTIARNRFFVIACTGFVLNQSAYAWALYMAGAKYYLPALGAVLVGVAIATFVLAKLWAFAQPQA